MTSEESASYGAHCAARIRIAIVSSMDIPGMSKVHWWGGFLAALGGFCKDDIGQEARDIIYAVTANAVENTTGRRPQ